jgi:hypothetical protein
VTLKEVEARLRREPELDQLSPKVVEALARAVMQLLQGVCAEVAVHHTDVLSPGFDETRLR